MKGVVFMRIGIMGGTLDPVHNGHLMIAKAVKDFLSLDRIMLLPAGDPPHKTTPTLKTDRLNMARIAAEETDDIFVCGIEIFREGTTFTVDTLTELSEANPNTEWFYIIGADTLAVLDTWRNMKGVSEKCTFAVVGRADDAPDESRAAYLAANYGSKFVFVPFNGPEISSTDIRGRAAMGEDVGDAVPMRVADYIRKNALYLCGMPKQAVLSELKKTLKPSRVEHTLGVADTAVRLAKKHGIDPAKAEIAALLHDCAKYMPVPDMQKMLVGTGFETDEAELNTPSILHAPAGSILAREKYGVSDPEILSAIRKHTIGDENMSPLDALIYTADFIEPGREYFPGLEEARALAEENIFAAMFKCTELTNNYLLAQGKKPHTKSLKLMHNEKYK